MTDSISVIAKGIYWATLLKTIQTPSVLQWRKICKLENLFQLKKRKKKIS